MNKLIKIIFTLILLVAVSMGYSTVAIADSKSDKKQITEMKQEIEDLGVTPIKKGLKSRKKYISDLKKQLEKLQKQKEKEAKKQALMDDLRKQIIDLDPDAKLVIDDSTDDLSKDEDIVALEKQLEDIKKSVSDDPNTPKGHWEGGEYYFDKETPELTEEELIEAGIDPSRYMTKKKKNI